MKTFQEWSSLGYKINKGSKGTKSGNNWYFSEQQVTKSSKRPSYSNTRLGDHKGYDNDHYDYRYDNINSNDLDDYIDF